MQIDVNMPTHSTHAHTYAVMHKQGVNTDKVRQRATYNAKTAALNVYLVVRQRGIQ